MEGIDRVLDQPQLPGCAHREADLRERSVLRQHHFVGESVLCHPLSKDRPVKSILCEEENISIFIDENGNVLFLTQNALYGTVLAKGMTQYALSYEMVLSQYRSFA